MAELGTDASATTGTVRPVGGDMQGSRRSGAYYLDSPERRAGRVRPGVQTPRLDALTDRPPPRAFLVGFVLFWCAVAFMAPGLRMAQRYLASAELDASSMDVVDDGEQDHDGPYDEAEPDDETAAEPAPGHGGGVAEEAPLRRRMAAPETVAQLPGLEEGIAKHSGRLQVLAAALGMESVEQILHLSCSQIRDVYSDDGAPLLQFVPEPTDVRPWVEVKQARIPSARAVMDLECHAGTLYQVSTFARSGEPWIPRWINAHGAPDRQVDFPEGGAFLEWTRPFGTLRLITMEPKTKDRLWIVMPPAKAQAFATQEESIFHAFCLNDLAMEHASGRRPSKASLRQAAVLLKKATALAPLYRKAYGRLCEVLHKLGERAAAREACEEARKSAFPETRQKAEKLLEGL